MEELLFTYINLLKNNISILKKIHFHRKDAKTQRNNCVCFCVFVICSLGLFFSCKNEKSTEEKKVAVKSVQDVNKTTTEQLTDILSDNKNDSVLILNKDVLLAYSFFKSFYID